MAFVARWTEEAASSYRALQSEAARSFESRHAKGRAKSSKAEELFKQLEKCVRLLLQDPRHPGLQTHEYSSMDHPYDPKERVFEAYVQNRTPGAYRLFWCYGPARGEITVIAITPHP